MPRISNLTNPYGTDWRSLKVVQGRVSPSDAQFLETLYPYITGLQDKIVAILYHRLINELRSIHATTPIEPAYYIDSPSIDVLTDLLGRCNFRADPPVSEDAARNDGRGADLLRPAVQPATPKRANAKGGTRKGSAKPRGKKAQLGKVDDRPSDGTPARIEEEPLALKLLREKGIL